MPYHEGCEGRGDVVVKIRVALNLEGRKRADAGRGAGGTHVAERDALAERFRLRRRHRGLRAPGDAGDVPRCLVALQRHEL